MTRPQLARNRIRCNNCDQVIESRHRHDLVRCQCGRVAVEGGTDCLRRTYPADQTPEEAYEELSERIQTKSRREDGLQTKSVMVTESQSVRWKRAAAERQISVCSLFRLAAAEWDGSNLPEDRPGPYPILITLLLPDETRKELKEQATQRGLSLSSLIRRLMDQRVSRMSETDRRKRDIRVCLESPPTRQLLG